MSGTAVQIMNVAVLSGLLLMTGCSGGEPDWQELTGDYWSDQSQVSIARYYSLKRVTDCEVREVRDTAEVRCRLDVKLEKDIQDVEKELGSVLESSLVAELTQRFGQFQSGEESTMAVVTHFRKHDGDWRVDPDKH